MTDSLLPLSDVIQALRNELLQAYESGKGDAIRFQVGPVDVDFTVLAKREGGPEGKIKFSVLGIGAELGGSARFAAEQTQRVRLTLTPSMVKAGEERTELEVGRKPPKEEQEEEGPPGADSARRIP